EVDARGFDRMDRALLLAIIDKFGGGPVGVDTLPAAIREEADTIEDVYEPFLIQEGFLNRTPKGRVATPLAYGHFGRRRPHTAPQSSLLHSRGERPRPGSDDRRRRGLRHRRRADVRQPPAV